tara:strand:- start:307 stop:495 length:189 start_codon:yes stop_codon:yes gene_type:complete
MTENEVAKSLRGNGGTEVFVRDALAFGVGVIATCGVMPMLEPVLRTYAGKGNHNILLAFSGK